MNNCKGRAGNRDAAPQSRNQSLRELGLATPQVAFERQNRSYIDVVRKSASDFLSFSRIIGNERSHQVIADCGPRIAE